MLKLDFFDCLSESIYLERDHCTQNYEASNEIKFGRYSRKQEAACTMKNGSAQPASYALGSYL